MKIDKLIRTRRKTIALIIQSNGSMVVRAPLRATNRQIQQLIDQKAAWIQETREKVKAIYPQVAPRQYACGETFLFLGKSHRLEVVEQARSPLALNGHFVLAKTALPLAEAVFTRWYRQQARQIITERAACYAAKYGFHYKLVKITSARTRWGSCSSKGALSFTWRLIMAPLEVIDYVVVHELVHTLERNHRKAFWERVQAILPDYKQKIAWLKTNGHLISL
jgi:predicted metal-dependent hydrolase